MRERTPQKTSAHFFMMFTFIVFSTGFSYIGYVLGTGKSMHTLEPAWAFLTIALGLLLTPVFYKHFFILVGDRGGICLEAGFIGMVVGFMLIITHVYQALPFLGMISLGSFFLGYVRLQELLFVNRSGSRSLDCLSYSDEPNKLVDQHNMRKYRRFRG